MASNNSQASIARIDTRDKNRYIKTYLQELKANVELVPFFIINSNETGFFDFEYITRKRISFAEIEKNLKDNRY